VAGGQRDAEKSPQHSKTNRSHRLTVSYLGTGFSGLQIQPGKRTVQGELEKALQQIWGFRISAQPSGRTDTGVHALAQIVSFDAPPKHSAAVLVRALNHNLPHDVRILNARLTAKPFHARFDAKGKTYEYRVLNRPVADPFLLDRALHMPRPLDVTAMRKAARLLVGKHDFASFTSNPGYERETTVRTIRRLSIVQRGPLLVFTVSADGFLYRMVRNIVGALLKIGRGHLDQDGFKKAFHARRRSAAPETAPAHGLYLKQVRY
jgi:tRNA pseudouridine38-40 synthase